jgi:hypothetical protein
MTERPHIARWRDKSGLLILGVVVTTLCWIVGNPRSSGPDEPSHMIASAGLVRGDREGRVNPDPNPGVAGTHLLEVPGMVGQPDPGCWVWLFDPSVPVACQNAGPLSTTSRELPTSSYNYPPWALVLPGLASFVPSAGGYAYLARLLNAAVPIVLVAWSLVALRRRRAVVASAALLGLTPIAWFTFGFVSPSATAIAGGLALWTGLMVDRSRLATWLTVGGWAAVLLPRRDGPVWATMIVLACCLLMAMRPLRVWKRLDPWARWTVIAIAPLPLVTPIVNRDFDSNLLLAFAPLALVVIELLARQYARTRSALARRALVVYSATAAALLAVALVLIGPGDINATTVRLVVANTGDHLRQLVGNLGWLSTPVPAVAVFLFWALMGGMALVAFVEYRRSTFVYLAGLAGAIVVAWLLELGQAADYGNYWQGRYTMPFAVGLPLVLAWRPAGVGWLGDQLTSIVAWGSWIISNVAFVAAQQRWGVGVNGTWNPFDWDTWGAPVWPWLLLLVHAGATAVLAACCTSERVRVMA